MSIRYSKRSPVKHVSEQVHGGGKAHLGDAQPFPWLDRLFAPPGGGGRANASSSISKLPHVQFVCLSPGFLAFALLAVEKFIVVVAVADGRLCQPRSAAS